MSSFSKCASKCIYLGAVIFLLTQIYFPLNAYAKVKSVTVVCEEPHGVQLFYYSNSRLINEKENEFIVEKTKMTNSKPLITWEENAKTATFIIQNATYKAAPGSGKIHSTTLTAIYIDDSQITFTGIVNEAPVMFTLYPKEKVGVYQQNTHWVDIADGVRAFFMYMKCQTAINESNK